MLALVREQVGEDRQLRRRPELRAASASGDPAAVRARIRDPLDISPFAQYGAGCRQGVRQPGKSPEERKAQRRSA
ncbi:hypothetical protein GCM10009577_70790 [Streptomyces javensis]